LQNNPEALKEVADDDADEALQFINHYSMATLEALGDDQLIKGFKQKLQDFDPKDSKYPAVTVGMNIASEGVKLFVPTFVRALRKFADSTPRDTYDPNIFKQALYEALNVVPDCITHCPRAPWLTGR
jgi:hypothetical protein